MARSALMVFAISIHRGFAGKVINRWPRAVTTKKTTKILERKTVSFVRPQRTIGHSGRSQVQVSFSVLGVISRAISFGHDRCCTVAWQVSSRGGREDFDGSARLRLHRQE